MAGSLEPNKLLDSQQMLRQKALERKKNIVPDKKHDIKWVVIALVVIALLCGAICLIPFWGQLLPTSPGDYRDDKPIEPETVKQEVIAYGYDV